MVSACKPIPERPSRTPATAHPLGHFPPALRTAWQARGLGLPWTEIQSRSWEAGLHLPPPPAPSPAAWLLGAPTSAGKSFVAEVAAAAHLLAPGPRPAVVWLVPTRALAAALCAAIAPGFATQGWRVACLTGEGPAPGPAELTVAVYERWFAALAGGGEPGGTLDDVGLLIADELGLLRDAERGPRLQAWLTLLPRRAPWLRRLGLLPPAPDAPALAEAWGARLLVSTRRPHPLHEGVVDLDTAQFRLAAVAGEPGTADASAGASAAPENLLSPPAWQAEQARWAEAGEGLEVRWLALAAALARRGEPTLAFAPTRSAARRWATLLATHGGLPAASAELQAAAEHLATGDPLADHLLLARALAAGVGVHHADLAAPARELVERAFAAAEGPKLLVATPTLAQGINLPVRNVLHWPWQAGPAAAGGGRGGVRGGLAPLAGWRLADQAGRAGRLGLCAAPGRSLWPAWSASEDRPSLPARPVLVEPLLERPLPGRPLEDDAAPLVALALGLPWDELAVPQWLAAGALRAGRLTAAGQLALRLGLPPASLLHLQALAVLQGGQPLAEGELLAWLAGLALAVPPGELPGESPRRHEALARAARAWLHEQGHEPPAWFQAGLLAPAPALAATELPPDFIAAPPGRRAAALTLALRMLHWLGPQPTAEVERRTGWSAGQLARAGKWLGQLASGLGELLGEGWPTSAAAPVGAWRQLGWRLLHGAPAGLAAGLAGFSLPAIGRSAWQGMAAAELGQARALAGCSPRHLARYVTGEQTAALQQALRVQLARAAQPSAAAYVQRLTHGLTAPAVPLASQVAEEPAAWPLAAEQTVAGPRAAESLSAEPRAATPLATTVPVENAAATGARLPTGVLLEIDLTSPCLVRMRGRELRLHPLGFDLLVALAGEPGRVMTREALYQRLWPDGGPEDQQLDAHRRKLAGVLRKGLGSGIGREVGEPIEVLRGVGFRLALEPSQVLLHRG